MGTRLAVLVWFGVFLPGSIAFYTFNITGYEAQVQFGTQQDPHRQFRVSSHPFVWGAVPINRSLLVLSDKIVLIQDVSELLAQPSAQFTRGVVQEGTEVEGWETLDCPDPDDPLLCGYSSWTTLQYNLREQLDVIHMILQNATVLGSYILRLSSLLNNRKLDIIHMEHIGMNLGCAILLEETMLLVSKSHIQKYNIHLTHSLFINQSIFSWVHTYPSMFVGCKHTTTPHELIVFEPAHLITVFDKETLTFKRSVNATLFPHNPVELLSVMYAYGGVVVVTVWCGILLLGFSDLHDLINWDYTHIFTNPDITFSELLVPYQDGFLMAAAEHISYHVLRTRVFPFVKILYCDNMPNVSIEWMMSTLQDMSPPDDIIHVFELGSEFDMNVADWASEDELCYRTMEFRQVGSDCDRNCIVFAVQLVEKGGYVPTISKRSGAFIDFCQSSNIPHRQIHHKPHAQMYELWAHHHPNNTYVNGQLNVTYEATTAPRNNNLMLWVETQMLLSQITGYYGHSLMVPWLPHPPEEDCTSVGGCEVIMQLETNCFHGAVLSYQLFIVLRPVPPTAPTSDGEIPLPHIPIQPSPTMPGPVFSSGTLQPYKTKQAQDTFPKFIILVGVGVSAACVCVIMMFTWYCCSMRRRKTRARKFTTATGCSSVQVSDEVIGKGGPAVIYKGIDTDSGVLVAVKRYNCKDTEAAIREYEMVSSLDHPNIVRLLGYSTFSDVTHATPHSVIRPFNHNQRPTVTSTANDNPQTIMVLMEYMGGGSVTDLLENSPLHRIPLPVVHKYTKDILDGLHYLHSKSIIHRDIHPGNLWFDSFGNCKLSDFALSHHEVTMNATTSVLGSLAYEPPELWQGGKPTFQGDVWMLGLTVLHMYTGYAPWPTHQKQPGQPLDICQLVDAISNTSTYYPFLQYLETLDPVLCISCSQTIPLPSDLEQLSQQQTFTRSPQEKHADPVDFVSLHWELLQFCKQCLHTNPENRDTTEQLMRHPFTQWQDKDVED